jgi:hypothetical protein
MPSDLGYSSTVVIKSVITLFSMYQTPLKMGSHWSRVIIPARGAFRGYQMP